MARAMTDGAMRCFDCLAEIGPGTAAFTVAKPIPIARPERAGAERPRAEGDVADVETLFDAVLYDEVVVCAGCAGWYRRVRPV